MGVDKKLDRFDFDIAYSNPMYANNNWFIWYLLFMNNRNSTLHKSFNNSFQGGTGTVGLPEEASPVEEAEVPAVGVLADFKIKKTNAMV